MSGELDFTDADFRVAEVAARLMKNGDAPAAVSSARALIAEAKRQRRDFEQQQTYIASKASNSNFVYTFNEAVVNAVRCTHVAAAKRRFLDYLIKIGEGGGSKLFGFRRNRETPVAFANRLLLDLGEKYFGVFTVAAWRGNYLATFPKRSPKKDEEKVWTRLYPNKQRSNRNKSASKKYKNVGGKNKERN